uniref:NADH-ubiquinone oxidoreductase chain 2 n=1 Tax=Cryptolestes turcicus TaxID=1173687 RepID=A0A0U2MB16_9CUCU|nr:NADH dehydrogenase subunit 2 [Cryptolestes turcicus]
MLKYYQILFLNTMILGIFITISSYSWFSMWLGLEINLLSIIPLLNSTKNSFPSESALKYFITQSMASAVILFAILYFFNNYEIFKFEFSLIMDSAILTKMGAAPFHFWFPEIIDGLSWKSSFMILTTQKIAPMVLIFYFFEMNYFFFSIIIISSAVGGIMGLNQTSIRKILAFSSINHISWLLSSMSISMSLCTLYFSIYTLIVGSLVAFFHKFHMFHIYQLINYAHSNKMINLSISLTFFSLGGLPPFIGFLPKWFVINFLVSNNFILLSLLLILFTLITLFYHIRMLFSDLPLTFKSPYFLQFNPTFFLDWLTQLILLDFFDALDFSLI